MTDVSLASAFGSIVLGELPHMSRQQAEDLLAEHALLGTMQCLTHGSYPTHSEVACDKDLSILDQGSRNLHKASADRPTADQATVICRDLPLCNKPFLLEGLDRVQALSLGLICLSVV